MNRGQKFFCASIASLALILCASRVHAQATVFLDIEVDEYGNGSILPSNTAISVPITGSLKADPGPGGLSSTLTYDLLATSLVGGDVFMTEGVGGPIQDVVRFNPPGTGSAAYPSSLVFYSDNVDGVDALADTPSPPLLFYTNTATIVETGTETNNGAFYTPSANQPGAIAGFVVNYHFISDLPEPSSVGAIGLCASLGLLARRQKVLRGIEHS